MESHKNVTGEVLALAYDMHCGTEFSNIQVPVVKLIKHLQQGSASIQSRVDSLRNDLGDISTLDWFKKVLEFHLKRCNFDLTIDAIRLKYNDAYELVNFHAESVKKMVEMYKEFESSDVSEEQLEEMATDMCKSLDFPDILLYFWNKVHEKPISIVAKSSKQVKHTTGE